MAKGRRSSEFGGVTVVKQESNSTVSRVDAIKTAKSKNLTLFINNVKIHSGVGVPIYLEYPDDSTN